MFGLTTYRGVYRDGKIELKDASLPEGTEVVVVAQHLPSIEDQKKRLAAIPKEEWEARFDEYDKLLSENPPGKDADAISDEELVALVHEVREEYRTRK